MAVRTTVIESLSGWKIKIDNHNHCDLKLETEIILDDSIIVMIDDRYIKDEVPGSMKSRALAIATIARLPRTSVMISLGRIKVSFSIPLITLIIGRLDFRCDRISCRQVRKNWVGIAATIYSVSCSASSISLVTSIRSGSMTPGNNRRFSRDCWIWLARSAFRAHIETY